MSRDAWVWDGNELGPKTSHMSRDAWLWNGREFTPKASSSAASYVASGDIPVPILALFAYSGLSSRLFRLIPAARSGGIRPPFPGESGHPPPGGVKRVVQPSLMGSLLGNELLVLRMLSPRKSRWWALWMKRSRMASARVGSAR